MPVVTGGAEPQEDGGIVRAWIVVDPNVYSDIRMPQGWRRMPKGIVVASGSDFVDLSAFCYFFVCFPNILNPKRSKYTTNYLKKK